MRTPDSIRPARPILAAVDTAPASGTAAVSGVWRTCWCGWEIVRDSRTVADLDAAAHKVQVHVTAAERERIAALVTDYQGVFNRIGEPLPEHLLPGIVDQALTAQAGQEAA
ncbi:hypothetical protein KIK06_29125 [Nocardiopsis sp. EMB25]|uniref:hypothetical protein n=1 Tax=Nocardiopsis sp. EMB25 TaxID=2835867 RepID=UPI00228426B7|nr:hypothetical protein [Nocardiopsis sp. EMB25]MCY9787947.1 hypothetical protein [Nocardiopsis sp. EMB25]